MAWLSRVNFTASDVLSYTDLNNLGNDIRAWGGNVNGGAYTLSNVILSASSGTMPTVIGGTGTTSTLTLRSTSGVGTTGADIILQTGNNGATEVMRLQNGGNVGIGTSSPAAKLDVVGSFLLSGQSTGNQYIWVGYGRSGNGYSYIDLQGDTTYTYGTRLIRGNTGANAISSLEHRGTGDFRIVNYEAAPICFYTSSTEKARFDSDGNLAIGTTSTTTGKLIVAQTNYSVPLVYLNHPTATWGTAGQFNSYRYIQTNSAATDGNWRAFHVGAGGVAIGYSSTPIYGSSDALYVNGNVGIGTSSPWTTFNAQGASGAYTGGNNDGIAQLSTSIGDRLEFGILNSSYSWIQAIKPGVSFYNLVLQPGGGNVGIGASSPAYQLELSTDSAAKPTTNTWTIASDSRLKTVKGEYQKGLAEICRVRPVRYEYNGKAGFAADGKDKVSILAQELMQVFPECVDTFKGKLEEDGPEIDLYNYNGHAITFALINAIKELKAKIDILEARN